MHSSREKDRHVNKYRQAEGNVVIKVNKASQNLGAYLDSGWRTGDRFLGTVWFEARWMGLG